MAQDVGVAIVRAYLKVRVAWAVPLVQQLLHEVCVPVELKANWPLVSLDAGVAFDTKIHFDTPGTGSLDNQQRNISEGGILGCWPVQMSGPKGHDVDASSPASAGAISMGSPSSP